MGDLLGTSINQAAFALFRPLFSFIQLFLEEWVRTQLAHFTHSFPFDMYSPLSMYFLFHMYSPQLFSPYENHTTSRRSSPIAIAHYTFGLSVHWQPGRYFKVSVSVSLLSLPRRVFYASKTLKQHLTRYPGITELQRGRRQFPRAISPLREAGAGINATRRAFYVKHRGRKIFADCRALSWKVKVLGPTIHYTLTTIQQQGETSW